MSPQRMGDDQRFDQNRLSSDQTDRFCYNVNVERRDGSMRWIRAGQLEQWARSTSARDMLPKIVSDRVRSKVMQSRYDFS